jgi:hypothetical protein
MRLHFVTRLHRVVALGSQALVLAAQIMYGLGAQVVIIARLLLIHAQVQTMVT